MKLSILAASVSLALTCSAAATIAAAQPIGENPPKSTIICIDVGGRSLPAVCHVPGSRLDQREDFCQCYEGQRVDVSICTKGVKEPADSAALDRARRAALKNGSLIGAMYRGQPLCVAGRDPLNGR